MCAEGGNKLVLWEQDILLSIICVEREKKLFLQQSLFRPKKDMRGREGQVIIEKSDKKEGGRKKVPQKSKMGIFLSFSLAWDEIAW